MSKDVEPVFRDEEEEPHNHFETQHYSAITITYYTSVGERGYLEIIAKKRDGRLNHRTTQRFMLSDEPFPGARLIETSRIVLELEDDIRAGKTAQQALYDKARPTPEQEQQMSDMFNTFTNQK